MSEQSNSLHFSFPGDPLPCPRPHVSRGHAYYRSDYERQKQAWSELASAAMSEACAEPFPRGARLAVKINFRRATRKRADIDNLVKSVLDALNVIAFTDDAQVEHLSVRVERGVGHERAGVDIKIRALKGG